MWCIINVCSLSSDVGMTQGNHVQALHEARVPMNTPAKHPGLGKANCHQWILWDAYPQTKSVMLVARFTSDLFTIDSSTAGAIWQRSHNGVFGIDGKLLF